MQHPLTTIDPFEFMAALAVIAVAVTVAGVTVSLALRAVERALARIRVAPRSAPPGVAR